jgi:hypothetical protein
MEQEQDKAQGPMLEQERNILKTLEATDFHRLIYSHKETILVFLQTEAGKALMQYHKNHLEVLEAALVKDFFRAGRDASDLLRGRILELQDFIAIPVLIENIQKRRIRLETELRNIEGAM